MTEAERQGKVMTVWVVFYSNYEPRELYGLYATEALAHAAVDRESTLPLTVEAWTVQMDFPRT